MENTIMITMMQNTMIKKALQQQKKTGTPPLNPEKKVQNNISLPWNVRRQHNKFV